jgi:hypothetical protein
MGSFIVHSRSPNSWFDCLHFSRVRIKAKLSFFIPSLDGFLQYFLLKQD